MKLKKITPKQRLAIIVPFAFVMIAFLIATQSYFNNKEIRLASNGCFEQGGFPTVEITFLSLGYSFSCDD